MPRHFALLAILLAAAPAAADDETSEHTAQLLGAETDTLGVQVDWTDATGWSMTVRPSPGADAITTKLALPKSHAHYIAYVAPGRRAVAFVEVRAGRAPGAKDIVGWVYAPDGQLLRSWTFGAVARSKELASTRVSTSHFSVLQDPRLVQQGVTFATTSGRIVMLAADATTLL